MTVYRCPDCDGPRVQEAKRCRACYINSIHRSGEQEDNRVTWNGEQRAEYGCIVTFENAGGERLTLHRHGPPTQGVKEACAIAVAKNETYRVIAYSTPQTILSDMNGSRADRVGYQGHSQRKQLPEVQVLAQVGLSAMLHPRLAAATDERKLAQTRNWRKRRNG